MSDAKQPHDGRFIASAAIIGLIALAGIIAVILRLTGGGDDDPARQSSPTANPSQSNSSSSACGLPDSEDQALTTAPATDWYFKGKVAVPSSQQIGPAEGREQGEVARCFAHSPAGAIVAAATIAAETSSFSPVAKAAIEVHVTAGPLRDDLLASLDPNPGPLAQIVGFKFEDYTADRTTVTLATRLVDGPNAGAIGATPMTLVWSEGDWKQELSPSASTVVVTSLDGFVLWSGIS